MAITIERSIDIEDVVREILASYMIAYCLPLPETVALPSVAVEQVGGISANTIDQFDVVLDARAEDEATALLTVRNAVGILKKAAADQTSSIHHVAEKSKPSWMPDTVRPDVAMCRARLVITAHQETAVINKI